MNQKQESIPEGDSNINIPTDALGQTSIQGTK
jgi:hypothetical protein